MFSGWGWVPKPKQPWHPLLIFLPRGGGGRTMALGGRFVAEMNEEASDGRPCQPRTSAQEGEATLQNNCWRYARELLFSSQDTCERVECSTNDTALAFPDIKDIYDQNRTAQGQILPPPRHDDQQDGRQPKWTGYIFFFFFFLGGGVGLPLGRNRGERVAAPAPSRVS